MTYPCKHSVTHYCGVCELHLEDVHVPMKIQVWDNKYNCNLFVFGSSEPITGTIKDCFIGKGGRGYSWKEIVANELLENDEYLPEEAISNKGQRFIIKIL